MEYKIPKSTIRSFINALKDMKINLEAIKKETLKDKKEVEVDFLISENKDKKREQDDRVKFQLYSLVLDIINRLEITIDKLIVSYTRGKLEEYIPLFDVIVAGLDTQNDFVIMILLDVIKHNAKFNKDKHNESLEKVMASLICDYQIKGNDPFTKKENKECFLEAYRKYLEKGYQVIAYLNGFTDKTKKQEKQVKFMQDSLESLPHSYELYIKKVSEKKEYVPNNTPIFTESNEVKYYLDGGKVLHMCDPKEFNDLLIKNGYSTNARYSMVGKMIKEISCFEDKELKNKLVGDTFRKLGQEYQEKWEYVCEKAIYCPRDILKDIYDYFYMIPGVDLGYGYTNDDIYNMMIIELLDVYDRLKETSLKRDK